MSFDADAGALGNSGDVDEVLAELARSALSEGEEEAALRLLKPAAGRKRNALLWQWTGLLHRALDEHEAALESFGQAARLAPGNASIAHGLARTALEAGLPASRLFERALALAPSNGDVLIGLAAARVAEGDGERAEAELRHILARTPQWLLGHQQLAQLRSVMGNRQQVTTVLEEAIAASPAGPALWQGLFNLRVRSSEFSALARDLQRARAAGVPSAALARYQAICAAELSTETRPAALFASASLALSGPLGVWRIRHLLRMGCVADASEIVDQELASDRAATIWPYAAITWRLLGDERAEWLEGDERFVGQIDLEPELPPLDSLAQTLRNLHTAQAGYLDQSVRGGTQSDGPLFCRIERPIRQLRRCVVAAVEQYREQLPAPDPAHPLLAPRRDHRVRFAGSWSVRLRGGGCHVSHVHPQGWISSALHVALPPAQDGDRASCLVLGSPPPELANGLRPRRTIEPKAGTLVLFPSYMWHDTLPFAIGERLTVAFDVAPPR